MSKMFQVYGIGQALIPVLPPPLAFENAPTSNQTNYEIGQIVYTPPKTPTAFYIYGGGGTWIQIADADGPVESVVGTTNQVTVSTSLGVATVSLPSAITTPGSLTTTTTLAAGSTLTAGTGITATTGNITASSGAVSASSTVTAGTGITATTGNIVASSGAISASSTVTAGTGITATTGNITASNGNLVLSTAGDKISIATGANASVGTSVAMTSGAITISTTAVTASSIIILSHNTLGGTPGAVSAPTASIVAGTSFGIVSSSNTDTSTVNWWIIN